MECRDVITDSYKIILDEKLKYQKIIAEIFQELKIEDKLVLKEIFNCQAGQRKLLQSKLEPLHITMRERICKYTKDDIPILGIDESRFKSFIEDIHILELDLRQYLNDSNMQDYI